MKPEEILHAISILKETMHTMHALGKKENEDVIAEKIIELVNGLPVISPNFVPPNTSL